MCLRKQSTNSLEAEIIDRKSQSWHYNQDILSEISAFSTNWRFLSDDGE